MLLWWSSIRARRGSPDPAAWRTEGLPTHEAKGIAPVVGVRGRETRARRAHNVTRAQRVPDLQLVVQKGLRSWRRLTSSSSCSMSWARRFSAPGSRAVSATSAPILSATAMSPGGWSSSPSSPPRRARSRFLASPVWGSSGNLAFLQLSFGYIAGRMLIAWLLLPQYLRGELFSAYQLLRQRFDAARCSGPPPAFSSSPASSPTACGSSWRPASGSSSLGWNSAASILVIGVVTMVYTYLGGMQAVIWTDLIQFVIYIAGAILAGGCIVSADRRAAGTASSRRAQAAGKFRPARLQRRSRRRRTRSGPASSAGPSSRWPVTAPTR